MRRRRGEVVEGLPLDEKLYAIKRIEWVSLATLSGRVAVPFRVGDYGPGWVDPAPARLVKGPNGSEMVNYRVKDNMYIVDRLFDRAALLLGSGKHQTRVELIRRAEVSNGKSQGKALQAQPASSIAEAGAQP